MLQLSSKAVQGLALALEGIDDVHGGNGLALGVLRVRDGIPDDVLEEDLEDAAGLLVDEARDALDAAAAREAADGGLGDALDVVPEDLAVALRAALAEAFATFAASRHDLLMCVWSDVLELGRGPRLGTGLTAAPPLFRSVEFPHIPKTGPNASKRCLRAGADAGAPARTRFRGGAGALRRLGLVWVCGGIQRT